MSETHENDPVAARLSNLRRKAEEAAAGNARESIDATGSSDADPFTVRLRSAMASARAGGSEFREVDEDELLRIMLDEEEADDVTESAFAEAEYDYDWAAEIDEEQLERDAEEMPAEPEGDWLGEEPPSEEQDVKSDEAPAEAASDRGPVGNGEYVVKRGDCIHSIAKDSGHFWETIWEDAANTGLREVRTDPSFLQVGDRVHVPELRRKEEPGETEQRHRFVRRGEPAELTVYVHCYGDPVANQPYVFEIDGGTRRYTGTTDEDGMATAPIPGNARHATLRVGADPDNQLVYELELGAIPPLSEVSGVQARLANLGFDCEITGRMDEQTKAALAEFQQKTEELEVTGKLDEATRERLRDEHHE